MWEVEPTQDAPDGTLRAMTIPRTTAKKVCSAQEYALVNASFPPNVESLHPTQVGVKAERARKLQDKYRQLLRKQERALKGELTPPEKETNARTRRKAQLFEETRARYEKRMKLLKDGFTARP